MGPPVVGVPRAVPTTRDEVPDDADGTKSCADVDIPHSMPPPPTSARRVRQQKWGMMLLTRRKAMHTGRRAMPSARVLGAGLQHAVDIMPVQTDRQASPVQHARQPPHCSLLWHAHQQAATPCEAKSNASRRDDALYGDARQPSAPRDAPHAHPAPDVQPPYQRPHCSRQRSAHQQAATPHEAKSNASQHDGAPCDGARPPGTPRAAPPLRPLPLVLATSRMEKLTHSSLRRLQQLMDADGLLNTDSQVEARDTNLRIPVSVVSGRTMNRGNPYRPDAMRRAGSGYNPAGTGAMNPPVQ